MRRHCCTMSIQSHRLFFLALLCSITTNWSPTPRFFFSGILGISSKIEITFILQSVYSRVARVCKSDKGGPNKYSKIWTSFLKSRLNCSIPGEFPFFFDEIQDVYKAASGSSSNNEEIYHAVFTTNQNGLKGSAICSFNLNDINNVFDNGKFKEQATSTSMWLPVPTKDVPEPRPGMHTYLFWIMNPTNYLVGCVIQKRK